MACTTPPGIPTITNKEDDDITRRIMTPTSNKVYFKRHEAMLHQLLNFDKPKTFHMEKSPAPLPTGGSSPSVEKQGSYKMPVDYEEAWVAIDAMMSKKGEKWQRKMRLDEQKEINSVYDQARASLLFQDNRSIDTVSTKLLDELTPDSCLTLRRSKSDPSMGYSSITEQAKRQNGGNDALQTVIVNTGVNWVCPANPNNQGLNATCMQPSSKSALTFIQPADCDNNFNIQAHQVTTRVEVNRSVVEDKDGVLHDERKMFYTEVNTGKVISPWHDISLIAHSTPDHISAEHGLLVNMVVEIPRFCSAKMEISTSHTHNPIIQDKCKKMNRARFYAGPIPWNYGALPQTWEDPEHAGDFEVNNALGDGDPLDVVDVGRDPSKEFSVGDVVPVRVLGCLPMLDGGDELDWKVLVINCYDNNFDRVHDLSSLEQVYPHSLTGVREWFRWYKFNDNMARLNDFGYMGLVICRCGAENIVEHTHMQWRQLVKKSRKLADQLVEEEKGKVVPGYLRNMPIDLSSFLPDQVWVPSKLRPHTKAWNDRYVIWQGFLARNAWAPSLTV
eukprot:GHVH01004741.1.p1 GENE.GHVH01004741.1~~GHVH01004741.1.p1  ORF type:complete len:558 (-),score=65.06 GHVH01004741.1:55-1728(-)